MLDTQQQHITPLHLNPVHLLYVSKIGQTSPHVDQGVHVHLIHPKTPPCPCCMQFQQPVWWCSHSIMILFAVVVVCFVVCVCVGGYMAAETRVVANDTFPTHILIIHT